MVDQTDVNKAIDLAFVAYERGKQETRAEFMPPKLWEFKGHAAADTFFELRVWGKPSAKALRNIIRQVELYHQFVTEDEAAEAAAIAPVQPDSEPADAPLEGVISGQAPEAP